MNFRLEECLMFLSGDSCEEEFPYLYHSKRYQVPTFGLVAVRAHEATFLDGQRKRIPPDQLQLRMWKYYQKNEVFRKRLRFLAEQMSALKRGMPLPEPDITHLEPPGGFWALVSGTVTEANHSGLRCKKDGGEIIGIMPYIFECRATEMIVEYDPKNDLFDEDTID